MNLAHLLLPSQGRLAAEDVQILARVAQHFPADWRVGNVEPSRREQRALPRFQAVTARTWDLRYRRAAPYDALVAARLDGGAESAERKLRSALASCRLLLVLDLPARLPEQRLLGSVPLSAGRLQLYRGDWTDALLRVDDYPTGVRPILADLTSLHDVLSQLDAAALPFHLGVVPALLDQRMAEFLRTLPHLVVSMHGYEHGYAKHSKILIEAGDPQNQRSTVTGFDEFAGKGYAEIESTLRQGRARLESELGQTPRSYIPPNNLGNRATGRALAELGFEYVLSERPIPGCALPCIRSDFYDRSPAFRAEMQPDVASLHATWEADLIRGGDRESLPRFVRALVAQRQSARDRAASIAGEILTAAQRG